MKMKNQHLIVGVLCAIAVILWGAIIDSANIFGENQGYVKINNVFVIIATCIVAGVAIGISFVYEIRDVKPKPKELTN